MLNILLAQLFATVGRSALGRSLGVDRCDVAVGLFGRCRDAGGGVRGPAVDVAVAAAAGVGLLARAAPLPADVAPAEASGRRHALARLLAL